MFSRAFTCNHSVSPEDIELVESAIKNACELVRSVTGILYSTPVVIIAHSENELSEKNIMSIELAISSSALGVLSHATDSNRNG